LTTRTEQETRRDAAVRGAVPRTGQRRPGVAHQSKPIPRPRPGSGTPEPRPARPARPGAARRRQRAPFVLLVVGLLCGGLVSLLLLNTVLNQDSITATNLRDEIAVARQQNEAAKQANEENMGPGKLAEQAENQGMRRDWDAPNPLTGASDSSHQVVPGR
jgi:hypothetical protein